MREKPDSWYVCFRVHQGRVYRDVGRCHSFDDAVALLDAAHVRQGWSIRKETPGTGGRLHVLSTWRAWVEGDRVVFAVDSNTCTRETHDTQPCAAVRGPTLPSPRALRLAREAARRSCPACGVSPGQRCRSLSQTYNTGVVMRTIHSERVDPAGGTCRVTVLWPDSATGGSLEDSVPTSTDPLVLETPE